MPLRMDAPLPLAGRYRFLRRLRGTSSGVIWLASDSVAGRTVVVSSVTSTRVSGLKTAVRLEHPHLATLLDLFDDISPGQIPGRVALRPGMAIAVAEYVTGQSLHERLETGPLKPVRAVMILSKLAGALHVLHGNGGVHGAMSPRSVIIARNDGGVVPILTNLRAAANGAYCSPERVRGGGPSAEDDTWALHATLYAALTGDSPYHGKTREELANAILSGAVPDLTRHGVYDADLQHMVQRGLASDRRARLCSVAELGQALVAWLRAHPPEEPERPSAVPLKTGTIAPPPIDDEDVAEGHRTVALASPVTNGRLPEDEEDDDDEMATVQLDASNILAHAMAMHGSPLGDADDPSLRDQVPTTVMSAPMLDRMVDQIKAEAAQARRPMPSETRQMEIAVGDLMPEVSASDLEGLDEDDGTDDLLDGDLEPSVDVLIEPVAPAEMEPPQQPAWPAPQPIGPPAFGGAVPGAEDALASVSIPTGQTAASGPQKGWGPAEPVPPHLEPGAVLEQTPNDGIDGFVDPAVAVPPQTEPEPPRKKRSIVWVIIAGLILMLLAAAMSFIIAVLAAGGSLPAPIASILGRGAPPPTSTPPIASSATPPAASSSAAPTPPPIPAVSASAEPVQDAAPAEPLSEAELQTCVEDYFPKDTFIRKVPFEHICKNDNPRKAAVMLHRQLVTGGAGAVTTGMKIWSSLSWYELAVIAIVRDGCCPGSPAFELPDPGEPCEPMTEALKAVIQGGCSPESVSQRAQQFETAVQCLFKHDRPRPYRYRGVVRPHQRIAFEEFLKGLPPERCKP